MNSKTFNTISVDFYNEDPSEILMGYLDVINMILMWRTIVSETDKNLSVYVLRQLDVKNDLEITICLESKVHQALLTYFFKIAGVEISESQLLSVHEETISMDGIDALDEWKRVSSFDEILYLSDFIVRPFIEISGISPCYEIK